MACKLTESGGHANIIHILKHGWLKGEGSVYYLDMELADFSLKDYIDDLYGKTNSANFAVPSVPPSPPVLVQKNSLIIDRLHNVCTISSHILSGLEFLHEQNQVHRDVKPDNGTVHNHSSVDSSSLLSSRTFMETD